MPTSGRTCVLLFCSTRVRAHHAILTNFNAGSCALLHSVNDDAMHTRLVLCETSLMARRNGIREADLYGVRDTVDGCDSRKFCSGVPEETFDACSNISPLI